MQATRGYGADVILHGTSVENAVGEALAFAERTGAVFIHPYDHPDIVAGQSTLDLEIIEQCPQVRTVVVPVGGGGFAASVMVTVKGLDQRSRWSGRRRRRSRRICLSGGRASAVGSGQAHLGGRHRGQPPG